MVGRKGYYKRDNQESKSVTKNVTIHQGELDTDGSSSQAMFQMAVKQQQPASSSDGIDIMDLPFFQAIRGSASSTPSRLPLTQSASALPSPSAPVLSIGNVAAAVPDAHPQIEECDSDEEDAKAVSVMPSLSFALPESKAKAKSSTSKPKSTPAPKAAKAKAKTGTGRKRSDIAGEDELLTLQRPTKLARGNANTEKEDDADNAIVEDFHRSLIELKQTTFKCEIDTEAAVVDCLKQGQKRLSTLYQQIKTKRKSLLRRKDKAGNERLFSSLDDLSEKLQEATQVGSLLLACSGEDTSVLEAMEKLKEWTFSKSMLKRALKCACTSNLKFADWTSLTTATKSSMCRHFGDLEGMDFFWMMVNELTQKLLRSLHSRSRVTWSN